MRQDEIKEFLEEKTRQYNQPSFIDSDPIFIPHQFSRKEDIEIAGFLAATLAWGNRRSILKSSMRLIQLMDNAPYDFVIQHKAHELERFEGFVHRTFQADDARYFMKALQHIYRFHGGLQPVMTSPACHSQQQLFNEPALEGISQLHRLFFSIIHPARTRKHVSDPGRGSVAKRLNMFLRWMVRSDRQGVDFGIWNSLPPSRLCCPLDVHSGRVARKLGLIRRKANDLKALAELNARLRSFDPGDPVKYDFALFGLGVFEKF
mgnify:CR=1 FL=1